MHTNNIVGENQIMEDKEKKKPSNSSFSFFFRRLTRKGSSGGGAWPWKLKLKRSASGKRRFNLHWFVDVFLFKIVSVFEGVVLVSALCFFYLCCGCHF